MTRLEKQLHREAELQRRFIYGGIKLVYMESKAILTKCEFFLFKRIGVIK